MDWAATLIGELWRHAWAVVPVAIGAILLTRGMPLRPATRHSMWVLVLLWFIAPLLLPKLTSDSIEQASALADRAVTELGRFAAAPAEQPALPDLSPPPTRDAGSAGAPTLPAEPVAWHPTPAARPVRVEVPATSTPPTVRPLPWQPPSLPLATGAGEPRYQPGALATCAWPGPEPILEADDDPAPLVATAPPEEPAGALEAGEPEQAAPAPALTVWLNAFQTVRATLATLPAMPAGIWLGGAVLLGLWHLLGLLWFAARMRNATVAPRDVVREVRRVARRCGLGRVPEVRMVSACISPLVLTGLRPRLYLPEQLWSELDPIGRRAILCHELAHLRRGDDWIRWGEVLISTICWWHPLVWWVRGRIHEEADLSCDSWVTWLMPDGRRAYAEALLRTNAYVSSGGGAMPTVGLGATSVGAKRFARRLTMVMTKTNRPGSSLAGGILLAGLMAVGWAALPAFSCPPAACDSPDKADKAPAPPTAPTAPAALTRVRPAFPTPPAPPAPFRTARAPRPVGIAASPMPALLVAGGDDTQDRVRDLEQQLRDMQAELRDLARELRTQPRPTRVAPRANPFQRFAEESDEVVVRTYELPKGKLKHVNALMIREDVPILVRPLDEGIEVHAAERHQRVFKAFCDMICGRDVESAPAAPRSSAGVRFWSDLSDRQRAELEEQRARVAQVRTQAIRGAHEELRRQMQSIEEQSHVLNEQASELEHEAERLREEADHGDKDARGRLNRAAREIERKARALERKAEALERKAEAMERETERHEEHADHDHDDDHDAELSWLSGVNVGSVGDPIVAIALDRAADAIRVEALPEVRQNLAEALADVQVEAGPDVATMLVPILSDGGIVTSALESVAETLDAGAVSDHNEAIEQALKALRKTDGNR